MLDPSYMVLGTRDNTSFPPPPRGNFTGVSSENVGRVKVDAARFFVALIKQLNVQIYLFLWVSLGYSITEGFAEFMFTSFIRISALHPKS